MKDLNKITKKGTLFIPYGNFFYYHWERIVIPKLMLHPSARKRLKIMKGNWSNPNK